MKTRQDAWTEQNDLLLAETVLRHIREGSTQLNAFEEVGDKLNRTSAACGFRWNAVVRDQYIKAIELAKKQRKQRQRALNQKTRPLYTPPKPSISMEEMAIEQEPVNDHVNNEVSNLNMEQVIDFLQHYDGSNESMSHIEQENDRLKKENKSLHEEKEKLAKQIERKEKEYETIQQDYQSLVQIMDRARKMVLFDDDEQESNTTFKMDRNGNLERVAKKNA